MPTSRSNKKRIVITTGDPAGIGPEVTLKALASPKVKGLADFLVVGDRRVLERLAAERGIRCAAPVLDMANVPARGFAYGSARPAFGAAAVQYLDKAVELLRRGEADALVTAPVNKASIVRSGLTGFQGHTEYLADKTGARGVVMMFVGRHLKVTLVTRHIAFRDVPAALTARNIASTIAVTHENLRRLFGIARPRIGVAGLNPHAGEGGLFGREDDRVIAPAVKRMAATLGTVYGPVPGDVIFHDALRGAFDAVVALYHDQGLIPFKMLYFRDGVNMTLGLPFIRTSPDHGTAFDIAGKGIADHVSMVEAVRLAARLAPGRPRC